MTSRGPARFFRLLADAEAVTWALLLLGMVLKYVTKTTDVGVSIFGALHGFVFLAYCLAVAIVAVEGRWTLGRTLVGLLAAVPPFVTVVFERAIRRSDPLPDRWRLADPQQASTAPERVVSWGVRRPLAAGGLILVGLVVLFGAAMLIGPPGGS